MSVASTLEDLSVTSNQKPETGVLVILSRPTHVPEEASSNGLDHLDLSAQALPRPRAGGQGGCCVYTLSSPNSLCTSRQISSLCFCYRGMCVCGLWGVFGCASRIPPMRLTHSTCPATFHAASSVHTPCLLCVSELTQCPDACEFPGNSSPFLRDSHHTGLISAGLSNKNDKNKLFLVPGIVCNRDKCCVNNVCLSLHHLQYRL